MASETSNNNDFTLVDVNSRPHLYDEYKKLFGGQVADPDVSIQAALRRQYPELSLTVTSPGNGINSMSAGVSSMLMNSSVVAGIRRCRSCFC